MLVETVRRFVESELYPHEALVDRTDEVPGEIAQDVKRKAKELGLYAANMPTEFGGGGLGTFDTTLMERELGRASYALQTLVARPSNILRGCTGAQIEEYLLPTVRGERVDCLAMTEPDAGSDVRAMRTFARADGGDFVINGAKHFISHADIADYVILCAATGQAGGRNTISCFLVDFDTPGLTRRRGPRCVSHRGYNQCELIFEDCRVPASSLLGERDRGFELMGQWLGSTRLQVAITSVGRGQRVLEMATQWAATRKQFGQTIGKFQGTSFKLADMKTELEAAELLTLSAAWKDDQGTMTDSDAAMAKLFASEALARATDNALQIFGGMGLMDELPIERFWRDARVERIWDGTSEIQRHIISRALLRPLEG
ncbi:MAG: acyl-CoA dehydrogenase family protein [Sphingomonadales bacterium]|nr:acyl-CoA dehydrogenase family protein [Sphingomonadales bacterium]